MANLLLLYDTKERDLARDMHDLLVELTPNLIQMIPLSPDKGQTLDEKERAHFKEATGAVFLITPGSERLGSLYPSPSVTHEMGQAKQKFESKPENVIYLVDSKCNLPAIDQKAYIQFQRDDARSIILCITQLVKNLKASGVLRLTAIPQKAATPTVIPKSSDTSAIYLSLREQIKNAIFLISNKENGAIEDQQLKTLLKPMVNSNIQELNFLLRDLEQSKTVIT